MLSTVFHTSSDIGRFVHLLLEAAKMLMQGNLSGYKHVCLEINAAKGEGNKEETGERKFFPRRS